jgi:hypothetical protein
MADLRETVDALGIVLMAPLWPRREALSNAGKVLHDRLVGDAKPYARAVASGAFKDALVIASGWSSLVHGFMDRTRIVGDDAAERLLRVYLYYVNQIAVLSKVAKAA